jgi:two-component system, chemotaxis family, protein-glutamate methylesterase/glutaminase
VVGAQPPASAPPRRRAPPCPGCLARETAGVRLWHGARENRSRRAIDPLFRSAAVARRGRVIGAVLSGLLDDGSAGLVSIKRGGLAFAQAPRDAIESEMPERAVEALDGSLDGVLSAPALGARLVQLVGSPAPASSVPRDVQAELEMLLGETPGLEVMAQEAAPLPLSCPECGGPLWGIRDGRLQRFRCHTGHTYGVDSLFSAQGQPIESALWAAIKGSSSASAC